MNATSEAIDVTDRISVFNHLTYDEMTQSIDSAKFNGLLSNFYNDFASFCESIETQKDKIDVISCYIDSNGSINFDITYKE